MALANTESGATDAPAQKRERLDVRISHEQKVLLQRAALLEGTTLTNFVIHTAQEAAERTIRERQVITLSARDSLVFAEALLNPPAPSARLRAAAARYQDLVEEV